MTRIIGGTLAGRRLAVPGNGARPTTDRVREAVFNSLTHRIGDWSTCRALDLFAGSGALGLEALSRGAATATLVDRDREAVGVMRGNVAALGLAGQATIIVADATRWVPPTGTAYDLVFIDPPYAMAARTIAAVVLSLSASGALGPQALLVVERSVRDADAPWPAGWAAGDRRRYGETAVWYGLAQGAKTELEDL